MMPNTTDHPIDVDALKAGNRHAWEVLYDHISGDLRQFAMRIGAHDPDDIVSETMLQVVRDITAFGGDSSQVRPWIFGVARNRVIDAARRARRRPKEVILDETAPDPVLVRDPTGEVDIASLRTALEVLTPEQREALWLRYALDFSLETSAEIMGSSPDAVASMTHRALQRLRTSPAL